MQTKVENSQLEKWKSILSSEAKKEDIVSDYLLKDIDFEYLTFDRNFTAEQKKKAVSIVVECMLNTSIDRIKSLLCYKNAIVEVSPANIPQFSNFASAAIIVPEILNKTNEPYSYEKLGYFLFSDAKSEAAATKYGENHGKMAVLLDLAILKKENGINVFESSALTNMYCNLEQDLKMKLLTRLCYRIPIIQEAIVTENPQKTVENSMQRVLAYSTYMRRKANTLEVLAFALEQ